MVESKEQYAAEGDDLAEQVSKNLRQRRAKPQQNAHVRMESGMDEEEGKKKSISWRQKWFGKAIEPYWIWIPPALTWPKLKPVFRSALVAWICLVLMVIDPVQQRLGKASFLLLIGAMILPAEAPFSTVIEREIFLLLILCLSWAYTCIPIAIAHAVRQNKLSASEVPSQAMIFEAQYLEMSPAIVCGFFLAFGVAILLYTKIRFGPSPFLFATILSCILLDITLTVAPLFPYANYQLAEQVVIPLAIKSGVTILVSLVFFPKSNNSLFVEKTIAILEPVSAVMTEQQNLLQKSPLDPDFNFRLVHDLLNKAEGGLAPLQLASRLVKREISFGHANGDDLKSLEILIRKLIPAADGMAYYFSMTHADLKKAHFPKTPIATPRPSRPATPLPSRPPSPDRETSLHDHDQDVEAAPSHRSSTGTPNKEVNLLRTVLHPRPSRPRTPESFSGRVQHYLHHHKHNMAPVGMWESLRYAEVEAFLHPEESNVHTELMMRLLGESSQEMLSANDAGIKCLIKWMKRLNHERASDFVDRFLRSHKALEKSRNHAQEFEDAITALEGAIKKFRSFSRMHILTPFKNEGGDPEEILLDGRLPHRYLYQAYLYQFHLLDSADGILKILRKARDICAERAIARFWPPDIPNVWRIDAWRDISEEQHDTGEEPEEIIGSGFVDVGDVQRRDPDALEPTNMMQEIMRSVFNLSGMLFRRNMLFAWKAAAMTGIISIPAYLPSTAAYTYQHKYIWTIFMSQLTLGRFSADTAFGFVSRIIATTLGALAGLVIWYISTGDGRGNAYGLAATSAIAFPMIFLARLYYPAPPITSIITTVTVALIIGYSWQDTHNPSYGNLGYGIEVGWRRLVGVIIGVTAAFVMSLLPPRRTLRAYQRRSHARTISELASLKCQVIAYAAHHGADEPVGLSKSLIALRGKLRRLDAISATIAYELTLRGKWPKERYKALFDVQMEISKLLSHFVSVAKKLPEPWAKALLRRTRMTDPLFIGDAIAVLIMCSTALQTGAPLPQITPCPLLDRYLLYRPGFSITRDDDDDHLGLPVHITYDILSDPDYFNYAVGCSTVAGLVIRLDKLMLLVKELVGEGYAVPTDLQARNPILDRYRR